MSRTLFHPIVLLLTASSVIFAQQTPADAPNAPASNSGWRQVGDQAPQTQAQAAPAPHDSYGQAQPSANRPPAAQRPAYGIPAEVTLRPGSFFTMRISQKLSDTKNSVGDTFSGTLMQPIVANGIVIAPRGQMVYGNIVEAQKVKGVHRLGIEVTGIVLADGTQATVRTQLMSRQELRRSYWDNPRGNITTVAADGSTPPAGPVVGVLATKGHDSVINPEALLTFRTENAVTVHTGDAGGTFRYVSPDDYSRPATQVVTRPAYVYGGYPYYGWGYPYPYWGPFAGFGIGFGGYWGGWHGGWHRW